MLINAEWRQEPADRRLAQRQGTKRKAVLVVNNGWSTVAVDVLNLSAEGALLELEDDIVVPEYFQMCWDGQKKIGRRVWARHRQLGVAFE
jgi:hypothetical protein